MESNFCYLFPTVDQQVQYFRTRDFSIKPPNMFDVFDAFWAGAAGAPSLNDLLKSC